MQWLGRSAGCIKPTPNYGRYIRVEHCSWHTLERKHRDLIGNFVLDELEALLAFVKC